MNGSAVVGTAILVVIVLAIAALLATLVFGVSIGAALMWLFH